MKIIVVAPESFPVPAVRGGAIQAGIEADTVRFTGHEVTVLGPADLLLPREELRGRVKHLRYQQGTLARLLTATYRLPFRSGNSRWFAWPYARWCAQQVRRISPNLIYVHSRPQFIPALKRACPNAKIVLHVSQQSTLTLNRVWNEALCAQIDHVIGVSEFIIRETVQRYPALAGRAMARIRGIDTQSIRPPRELPHLRQALRKQYGAGPGDVVLLYVGRLVENKGAHVAIEALTQLQARTAQRILLVVVGSGSFGSTTTTGYTLRLEALAAHAQGAVQFTGFIPPHRVPEMLLMSDCLVVPSLVEDACPRTVLEAMAAGVPVVAFRRGGIPELVENGITGRLVEPSEGAGGLADALEPLVADAAAREAMGRVARARAEARFDPDTTAQALQTILEAAQGSRLKGHAVLPLSLEPSALSHLGVVSQRRQQQFSIVKLAQALAAQGAVCTSCWWG
jgi:spore coat protein SA